MIKLLSISNVSRKSIDDMDGRFLGATKRALSRLTPKLVKFAMRDICTPFKVVQKGSYGAKVKVYDFARVLDFCIAYFKPISEVMNKVNGAATSICYGSIEYEIWKYDSYGNPNIKIEEESGIIRGNWLHFIDLRSGVIKKKKLSGNAIKKIYRANSFQSLCDRCPECFHVSSYYDEIIKKIT